MGSAEVPPFYSLIKFLKVTARKACVALRRSRRGPPLSSRLPPQPDERSRRAARRPVRCGRLLLPRLRRGHRAPSGPGLRAGRRPGRPRNRQPARRRSPGVTGAGRDSACRENFQLRPAGDFSYFLPSPAFPAGESRCRFGRGAWPPLLPLQPGLL